MRQNQDIVLCAVKQEGAALQFAGNELCKNAAIITAACNQDPEARQWVAAESEKWEDESDYMTDEVIDSDSDEHCDAGSNAGSDEAPFPKRQKNTHSHRTDARGRRSKA